MQLMPATGEALGLADPFDPEANIRAGTRYLKAQLSRFSDLRQALAAYNAGPGKVLKYGGVPPFAETQEFVRRVLEFREAGR
jgi:soluble lytic murein transglycosylase-like protein